MAQDRHFEDDDGRTVADMSGVGSGLTEGIGNLLTGRRDQDPDHSLVSDRPISSELQDAEERLAVLMGTLRAALSIGMVYVIGFGIAIAIMLWIWT